jgi:anti-anti-sigma factor
MLPACQAAAINLSHFVGRVQAGRIAQRAPPMAKERRTLSGALPFGAPRSPDALPSVKFLETQMRLESEMLDDDILKITLDGRLDVEGTQAIDMKFTALAATKKAAVLVDMTNVSFLASIGMRTLLTCAKAASNRGGKLVLLKPQPMVKEVMDRTGVASLIPVYDDLQAARAALRESRPS